ncbi:hypothetical protein D3C71_1557540 [compost metagenome]
MSGSEIESNSSVKKKSESGQISSIEPSDVVNSVSFRVATASSLYVYPSPN